MTIQGKDHYLGPWKSKASKLEYDRLIGEWLAADRRFVAQPDEELTVTELVAARQLVRMAATKLDAGHPDATTYCAMAKRFATDVGFKVCDEALQLYGGNGYIKEYPMERYVRDTRVHRILEGTNEIMRLIISRRVLADGAAEL